MINRLLILILIFVIIITSYKEAYSQVVKTDLLKFSWELKYFRDSYTNAIKEYPIPKKVIITFRDSLPIIKLKGVCNNGIGQYNYSAVSDSIKIKIAITMMNCPEIDWDERVSTSLRYAYKCKIVADEMTIYSNAKYDLCFKRM